MTESLRPRRILWGIIKGMKTRGFSTNILLIIVGAVLVIGAFAYSAFNAKPAPSPSDSSAQVEAPASSTDSAPGAAMQNPAPSKPATSNPKPPVTNAPKPPASGNGGGATGTATAPAPTTTPTPTPTPAPSPTPAAPYSPGFLATARVTPEIPSENDRAKLPACEGKLFTLSPINFSSVSSITANGSTNSAGVPDYAVFKVIGTGELNKYDVSASADVYVTHITQEFNVTKDAEDDTIYFALCKDVFGYITNVKELSTPIYKFVTDSNCFGKPQTGPNACNIDILEQISKGSPLGKVGRFEGTFGFGVIDLRKDRGLANAASLPIKTNFAACPFAYFSGAESFYSKLTGGSSLCPAP